MNNFSDTKIYGIYGIGGFAREVAPVLNAYLKSINDNFEIYFISELESEIGLKEINSYKIMSFENFLKINSQEKYISLAISNSQLRMKVSKKCKSNNLKFFNIVSTNSVVMDNVSFDEGVIICPYVTITSNIKIGKHFHANIYSYVAHDCQIGNYVTLTPAVKCNGNIIIEDNVYIGTGAILKQGKKNKPLIIGKNSVVAAGSFVTKNVLENTTVIGNPANILKKSNIKPSNE